MFNKKIPETSHSLMEQAAQSTDAAIQTTQRMANDAMEGLSHSLQTARHQVRTSAHHVSDKTVAYVRDEPVKSILIAAAAGAALMVLARVFSRSDRLR